MAIQFSVTPFDTVQSGTKRAACNSHAILFYIRKFYREFIIDWSQVFRRAMLLVKVFQEAEKTSIIFGSK